MVAHRDDAYGMGLAVEFAKEFTQLGGQALKLVTVAPQMSADFGDIIPEIYAGDPDVVICSLLSGVANAQLLNESIGQHFDGLYLVPDTAMGSSFTDNLASDQIIAKGFGVSPSAGVESNPQFFYLGTHGILRESTIEILLKTLNSHRKPYCIAYGAS